MTRKLIALSAAIVVTAVSGLAAQDKGKEASFTGCVASGSTAGSYTLTNAMPAAAEKASGIAGALGGDKAKNQSKALSAPLLLTGNTADLSKHLGHKITVKGTVTGDVNKAMEEGAKTGANKLGGRLGSRMGGRAGEETAAQTPAAGTVAPTMKIDSISMVAATCP